MSVSKLGVDLTTCAYCNTAINEFSRTVDHLFPKSRGGKLSNKNKVPACKKCNQLKGDMSVKEFKRALNAMIHFEQKSHTEKIGYLKKVKINTDKIIQSIQDEQKRDS